MSPFDEAYLGVPPWEIGRPQPAIEELFDRGKIQGRVLDIGCGTGEHALLAAARGFEAVGVDNSAPAVARARAKAKQRGLPARFEEADALRLEPLRERFDTAIDSGLFHVFSTPQRYAYARSLSSVLRPGATLHVLCFNEHEPNWGGPRRVKQVEIHEAFSDLFVVERIVASRFATRRSRDGSSAWLATIAHVGRRLGSMV